VRVAIFCPTCGVDVLALEHGRCHWCGSIIGCELCGAPAEHDVEAPEGKKTDRRYCDLHVELAQRAAQAGRPLPTVRYRSLA
jgi:hypothetical protein